MVKILFLLIRLTATAACDLGQRPLRNCGGGRKGAKVASYEASVAIAEIKSRDRVGAERSYVTWLLPFTDCVRDWVSPWRVKHGRKLECATSGRMLRRPTCPSVTLSFEPSPGLHCLHMDAEASWTHSR